MSRTASLAHGPQALESIESGIERIEYKMARLDALLDQVPGMVAAATDAADESAHALAARGLDLDARMQTVGLFIERLTEPDTLRAVTRLLGHVQAVESALAGGVLADVGDALAATAHEPPGKAGLLALWRASRDPDVQRALDLGIRFLRRFGALLAAPDESQKNRQKTAAPGPVIGPADGSP